MNNFSEQFAFIQGWRAWFAGIALMDNPYPVSSVNWKAWRDGWFDAE
ncbi:MAG: hypothetical protein L0220_32925 [Acidobacteria bacterium]|nr:hypothetical protein [Acidobacteriota bacterium]